MISLRKQKAALITGAARRIGRHIALRLTALGYAVAIHYNNSQRDANDLANRIRAKGGHCELFQCDLRGADQTQRLIERVYEKFSGLNLLINSASIFQECNFKNSNWQNLDENFSIHLRAPYILTSEFAKICKSGQIINMLEAHIDNNHLTHFDYLLTKKALAEFTKLSAMALAPAIRVNGIAPGLILAPITNTKPQGYLNRLAKNIPLKRKGGPEKIAKTVEFFLTNDFITGQIIFVDGGEHLL